MAENAPAGKELPDDIYVVIEIPANSLIRSNTKWTKKPVMLFVDRFMATAMPYPANYGYVNNNYLLTVSGGCGWYLLLSVTTVCDPLSSGWC